MSEVTPISREQKNQVIAATEACLRLAADKLDCQFSPISVVFDLKGKTAGMYQVKKSRRVIRYNPYIFVRYFSENLSVTVPHEVAHYIVDVLYGMKNTLPHGEEWRNMMAMFNADASVTCCFDLEGIPTRQYQRVDYRCSCRIHRLTRIRHNRAVNGVRYYCRSCKSKLVAAV